MQKEVDMDAISLNQIAAFLSVAKHLSMTKGANELCLTQSAISQRISAFENKLGLILFARGKNGLQLSPAGKQLYADLSQIYYQLEVAFSTAQKVQTGKRINLSVGIDSFFDWELLFKIVERFQSSHQYVNVELVPIPSYEEVDQILSWKKADITITVEDYVADSAAVSYKTFLTWQLYALVNRSHPLAEKDEISIRDLFYESLLIPVGQSGKLYLSLIKKLYHAYGKHPIVAPISGSSDINFLMNVVLGKGIAIGSPGFWEKYNARLSLYAEQNIKPVRIDGATMELCFAWLKDNTNPVIADFLGVLDEWLGKEENSRILNEGYNGNACPLLSVHPHD